MQIKLLAECPHAQPLTQEFLESQNLSASFPKRFWKNVKRADQCWFWTSSTNQKGYGRIGRGGRKRRMITAHRASWIIHYGPVPENMFVLHHCDFRSCVRPDHLWLGTQIDNLLDMRNKGREARGARIPNAKLTYQTAQEIRSIYDLGTITMQTLADAYGIGLSTVFKILHNETWRLG